MIKRIQEIKSVGCFKEMTAHPLQFEPITIIYGENTYGKSTLCDVLRSLADENPEYITNRKSIPNPNNISQSVEINFEPNGDSSETTYKFNGGEWDKTLPDDLHLLVFDTNFIYRNVFTGLTIERNNYENVTQFVLGEESVKKAEEIAEIKSKLRKQKKGLKELESESFEGVQDIKRFIELEVQEDLESLDRQLEQVTSKLTNQRELRENIKDIQSREEPGFLNLNADLSLFIEEFNAILKSSIEQIHEEVKNKVLTHIKNKTQNLDTTQSWIFKGLDHIKDEECPFCGQELDDAIELIELYKKFFDLSYKQNVKETKKKLSNIENDINGFQLNSIRDTIDKNKAIINQYDEIKNEDFKDLVTKLEKFSESLIKKINHWDKIYPELKKEIKDRIQTKRNAIQEKISPFSCNDELKLFKNIEKDISQYETVLKKIIEGIQNFKTSLNTEEISEKISNYKTELSNIELQKRRINSKNACQKYIDLEQQIDKTQSLKENLEDQLEKEQTAFLDKYFDDINKIFNKLGSTKFSIYKKVSKRGDLPTIQIKAKYAGKTIKKDKIKAFFSESDKRALALAIFWAKIESFTDDQRNNTVVVLDDPVTSFDDGRIEQSIRLFNTEKYNLRQLVIISHYPRYLKSFFDRLYNDSGTIKLLRLEKDTTGSKLVEANRADFIETPHQKMLRRINGFVERKHTEDIEKDLRVYLENELRSRYRKQILELSLKNEQFGNLINELNTNGIIKDPIAKELHELRKSLNPSHHKIRDRSDEDMILLARDVLDFIYNKM
ncbi:AAA family ATPase [Fodinibius sp. SL11]|uniref:AAA family ATPase n=1 Tax=Fodinibius sp. SL11 TaxID=3425690 RepID=UPI003F883585